MTNTTTSLYDSKYDYDEYDYDEFTFTLSRSQYKSTNYWLVLGLVGEYGFEENYHLTHLELVGLGECCAWVSAGGYGGQVTKTISLIQEDDTILFNGYRIRQTDVSYIYDRVRDLLTR